MVSQDRNEIYLTLSTLDRHYRKYLANGARTERFLELHQYGPWRIDNADHMEDLAGIILAFVLRVGDGREPLS